MGLSSKWVLRQNRRPDEEGIKTWLAGPPAHRPGQNRRPDEEGIKTRTAAHLSSGDSQNRRPDEEGIKTQQLQQLPEHACQNRRPDEEGIKTDLLRVERVQAVKTVDLMKKGLRRPGRTPPARHSPSEP